MTETASQLNARQGGAPPTTEAVKHTLQSPQSQAEGQLGQAQPAMQGGAQQATTKAKPVGQLTLLKAYPTKRPPQVPQKEELADPWTELPELPMCAVTSPRVSSSKTTSQQQQQRQRSRLSYEQWLIAKNKADAQQRRRQRREQQRQRHEQLQRQQLAAHSFKLWLKGKQRQQCLPRVAGGSAVSSSSSSSKNATLQQDVASRRYVQMWQRRKLAELATQRESQQQRQQQQQLRNELRRQLSDLAFERWLAQSAVKRQLKLGTWQRGQQQAQQQRQQGRRRQPQQQQQQQLWQQRQQRQPQRQQRQAAAAVDYSLYLHVPLSAAQQALRDRLQGMRRY